MSTILVLAKLGKGTGNKSTAERIMGHISSAGWKTFLCDVTEFESPHHFSDYVVANDIKALVVIHAYRGGKLLKETRLPFVLVFGGTDVQCSTWNDYQNSVMADVVSRATTIVAFSEELKRAACVKWPLLKDKEVLVQCQGVNIEEHSDYTFKDLFEENKMNDIIDKESKVFLFVGGIRPIKDPLFLMETVSKMHKEDPNIIMVIIGPELDEIYTRQCRQKMSKLNGIFMFRELPRDKIHALLHEATALVNSSINEGMAGAILEAMKIGTPVVARQNSGNASIVQHRFTGFLFNDQENFQRLAKMLLEDKLLAKRIVENARSFLNKHHDIEVEEKVYRQIIKDLCYDKKLET